MAKDAEIRNRLTRVEEIIEQLDDKRLSGAEGEALYEEGQQLLTELRALLHDGEGEVIELE